MEGYVTIRQEAEFEYEDRKSLFIGSSAPVKTEAEALAFIEKNRRKYPDAKHHVYAYVLRDNSIMRFSDDHEPQGTAGMPVLDVIRKSGCSDAVIVVTRYFGGTLLGTGGLVRAYTAAASGALNKSELIRYEVYSYYELGTNYSDYQKISPFLESFGFRVEDTEYSDNVIIKGSVLQSAASELEFQLVQISSGRIEINKLYEKYGF